jgi:hypothetical protein
MSRGPAAVALLVLASALGSFASFASRGALGAEAPAPMVVLLNLARSDEVTTEAMARVKGELAAAGFEVAVVPLSGDDALHALESAGRERNAVAAFAIFVKPFEGGTTVAEIWVSDRIRQKVVIQNAVLHETDRGRGSEILAVRAVEVLKANLADLWTQSPVAASPPDVPPPAREPRPAAPAQGDAERPGHAFASGLGAGLGAGFVEGFAGSGPAWSPEAMASYGWAHGLSVRATFAGLGPAVTFSASNGSADVERQLALLEAVKTWWPRAVVVPFVMAGSGAQHVRVAGAADAPYQGHTSSGWSLLTEVGAGIAVPLVSTLSAVVQIRGLAAWPSTVVQIAGAEVGRVGGPSLLADAGLFGTLP